MALLVLLRYTWNADESEANDQSVSNSNDNDFELQAHLVLWRDQKNHLQRKFKI